MPRLNLYLPNERLRRRWEKAAKEDNKSLSQFIRIAVEKHIKSLQEKE